jgi:hypothetical protein
MDMDDRTLVMVMTQGIGANLTNDETESASRRSQTRTPYRPGMHSGNLATPKITARCSV